MRKLLVRVLTVALLVSMFSGTSISYAEDEIIPSKIFSDVVYGDWYVETLTAVLEREIIAGYPDETFRGEEEMTVDQFVKTMVVAIDGEQPLGDTYWASEYIAKAIELGIITEDMFNNYEKVITRAEMALISENTLSQLEGTYSYQYTDMIKSEISDITAVNNSGYGTSIVKMYEQGILKGYPDGEYKPNGGLKRQEAITVIIRVIDARYRAVYNYYSDYPEEIQAIIEEMDLHPMEQADTGIIVTPENISSLPDVDYWFVKLRDNITISVYPGKEYTTEGDYYLDVKVGYSKIYESDNSEDLLTYRKYMLGDILREFGHLEDDEIEVITDKFEEMYYDYALYRETGGIIEYINDWGYTEVKDPFGRTMIIFDHNTFNLVPGFNVRGFWEDGHPYDE